MRSWSAFGSGGEHMEEIKTAESRWCVWVNTQHRVIFFHETDGCELLEFQSREMFLRCIDQYTAAQYRYMQGGAPRREPNIK